MVLAFLAGESGESGRSGRSGESGESSQVGGATSPLLSTALMFSHDGIVGTNQTQLPAKLVASELDVASRLGAVSRSVRSAVLDFELIEPVHFRLEKDRTARILCRTSEADEHAAPAKAKAEEAPTKADADPIVIHRYAELVSMRRPELTDKNPEKNERRRRNLKAQTEHVRLYADLRPERIPEIQAQMGDILSFFGALDYFLDPERTKWTLELLALAVRFAIAIEMRIKHALNHPRVLLFSPYIQPIIQTPTHGSFPSGHATEAFIVATVLTHLVADRRGDFHARAANAVTVATQPYRLATRIAVNRTIAGVHYPVDSAAGAVLGITLGDYLVARASRQLATNVRHFDGDAYGEDDFFAGLLPAILDKASRSAPARTVSLFRTGSDNSENPDKASTGLEWVWRMARREMNTRWG